MVSTNKMEAILRTAMQSLDKDVVVKVYQDFITSLTQVEEENTTKPIKTKAKKEAPKDEKKQKRIPRMSAVMLKQLQSEFSKADIDVDFDDKKQTDKVKKNFVAYVDDLTEDDFAIKNLAQHMRDFANLQTKKTEEKEETQEDTIHKLTLKQLQAITLLSESEKLGKGVYWDGDSGRQVTGPDRDDDEELDEKTFKKTKYIVGDTTGRIYTDDDDQEFVGYIGIGKFKEMI